MYRNEPQLPKFWLSLIALAIAGTSGCSSQEAKPQEETPYAMQVLHKDDPDAYTQMYPDLDQDGVPDRLDHCQNSRMGSKVNRLGCEQDSDADGVLDRNDQCPNTPPGVKVNFLGCEPDSDRDGVPDSKDLCPNTPLGVAVDENGCPFDLDTDRDGVLNDKDKCPDTPLGTKVNEFGCKPEVIVLSNIVYDIDSSVIRDDQASILDQNASRLKKLTSKEVVLITGHTDSTGSNEHNLGLSWRRADSAKEFLIRNLGFKDDQILIMGKGETSPISDNSTAEGRHENRRIEMKVIKRDDLPEEAASRLPEQFQKLPE